MNNVYNSQEKKLVKDVFLIKLGEKIKTKRKQKCIKQENLGTFLGVSKSTVSQYEAGAVDFPVANLPLISNYCDFPITDFFDAEMLRTLAYTFEELAIIIRSKKERKTKRNDKQNKDAQTKKVKRELKGYIYEVDGVEQTIPVTKKNEATIRKMYLDGDVLTIQEPFSVQEFEEYIRERDNNISALNAARHFLSYIGDTEKRETIKSNIAEFIMIEIMIIPLIEGLSNETERLYALYKSILEGNSI